MTSDLAVKIVQPDIVLFQGYPQSVMGLPGLVCGSEGLGGELCAWAGDPQS